MKTGALTAGRSPPIGWLALALVAIVTSSCRASGEGRAREYMPDMVRSPSYKAFARNAATADGLTLRPPVVGTIARGQQPFHFGPGEEEAVRAGLTLTNPHQQPSRSVLQDGKGLYDIYCSVCHGSSGNGDGPLAGKIPPPPAYRSERVASFTPGRMYHVLTVGSGKMPSYAAQLSPDERWKVITFVQATLQGKQDLKGIR